MYNSAALEQLPSGPSPASLYSDPENGAWTLSC